MTSATGTRRSILGPATAPLLIALAYFTTGWLGMKLPAFGPSVSLIWLPTGIAVAALLRWGFACWTGIALGALGLNLVAGTPTLASLGVVAGNTLGPVITAGILRRMNFHRTFDRSRDILLLATAAALGMLASSSLGVGTLVAAGRMLPAVRAQAWVTWWTGDAMGVIIAAPVILTFTAAEVRAILRRRGEFSLWAAGTMLATWAAFIANHRTSGGPLELSFLPLPFLAWAALRFGTVGTSLGLILLGGVAAYGTAAKSGPFHSENPFQEVSLLSLYMATSAILGWLISAIDSARRKSTELQRLLERALSDVSLGVLLTRPDHQITYANDGFTRLTGYTLPDVLGKSAALLHGPETSLADISRIKNAVNEYGSFDGEVLNYRKNGTTFWNGLVVSPVQDERGALTGFLGIQRDITERKAAAAELERSLSTLQLLIDSVPAFISFIDTDERYRLVNRKYEEYFRLPAAQLIGKRVSDLQPAESYAEMQPYIRAALDGQVVRYQTRGRGPGGARHWFDAQYVPRRNDDGAVSGFFALVFDITDRQLAQDALRASEDRFRMLIDYAPEAIVLLDITSGHFVQANPAAERLFRLPAAELRRVGPMEMSPPVQPNGRPSAELGGEFIARAVAGETPVFEWTHRDANGADVLCEVRLLRLEIDGRTVVRGSLTDITERRRAQAERDQLDRKMQETQKLESLGVLAGGIAHDFNNLLTSILGNASIAAVDVVPGSQVQESIERITEASLRAADLCRQMLAYSGRGRFVVQPLDLSRLVEQTAQMLQISISKKALLRFRLAEGLPAVEADATQIRQVIMNLVINASEAIGDRSGVISLSTGLARVDGSYLRDTLMGPDLPDGDYVFLEVSDSGSGMTSETQARIFDPFFTTKFTGRGLGLAAVLGIVRGHRGALKVYSEVGRGTTFKLLFPATTHDHEASMPQAPAAPQWLGSGTVLVVDDEETMRTTVGRMMRVLGLEPVLAADGREAVEIFRADPDRFSLVLLDLTMPHLDGEQTFAELRRLRAGVRVVLMSGFNAQEAMMRFNGKGLAGFLQKPFALEALRDMLHTVAG